MIVTRSPLRITLGGGGTDLPSYYREHEGFLISAAIDKYVYVTVTRPFNEGIYLKYSHLEQVGSVREIKHPIIREAIQIVEGDDARLEITALADIPAGTGLGSSGSFTTALLKALYAHNRRLIHARELAELACHIEVDLLHEPIGKQDQYIAAFGGLTCFNFAKDDTVVASQLRVSNDTLFDLEDNLLLFFTGFSRSAGQVLKDQNVRTKKGDEEMLNNLHFVKDLGLQSKAALEAGDPEQFGRLLHEHWEHKKNRSEGMSNATINAWYEAALKNGAVGGKLVGAGGGGFLMFYATDRNRLRHTMASLGVEEVRFRFDFEGTKIVLG